ncbi:MAG: hypothetical protein LBH00_12545 [Planctomycetaceae bacterium]|nr:hypothetical protein [Planctomycetaceae bacterium]
MKTVRRECQTSAEPDNRLINRLWYLCSQHPSVSCFFTIRRCLAVADDGTFDFPYPNCLWDYLHGVSAFDGDDHIAILATPSIAAVR